MDKVTLYNFLIYIFGKVLNRVKEVINYQFDVKFKIAVIGYLNFNEYW